MEPMRGPGARPQRKRKAVDYAAVNEGVEKVGLASRWIPHLERTKDEFVDGAALGVARLATGSDLNDAWARKTDLRTPAIIASTEGLGMTLPEPHFMVRDVAKVIGEEKPVQVMRSRDQSNLDHWSLGDWSRYYDAPRRQEVLNVISLEFSRTALAGQVVSPEFVRKRDWIDTAWPANLRAQGHWPQVQYYCLMSTAGCYTDFHVDFGGTAVWYHVFRGQKVFYLIKPTPENLKAYEAWICDAKQDSTFFPDTIGGPTECARVEINAGETFFIPSSWLHAVLTPVDSLVFGGNFLPGLATVDLQLAVRDIEKRTHVKKEYTFPLFIPCLFFGLADALARLKTTAAASQLDALVALTAREDNKDVDVSHAPPLTAREHRGLAALIEACGAWAGDETACDDRERPFLTLAAEAAGCTSATELVAAAREALAAVPEPKPKFTIKLQRDDEAAPAPPPPKVLFSPAASYGGARPGYVFMTGSRGLGYYLEGTEAPPAPSAAPPPPVPEEAPVRYRAGPAWDRMAPAPAPVDEDDAEFELAAAEERKRAAPRPRKAPKPAAAPKPAPRPSQWAKAPGHTVAKKGTGTAKGRLLAKLGKKRR